MTTTYLVKMLEIPHERLGKAADIEDILCLSTLIANGELPPNGTLDDSRNFFENETQEDCSNCPFAATCLACIINE